MINEDPNMGRKQVFSELPLPSKVEEKGILTLIYKGVFIAVKLLLDIRLNLVKISEGKPIKTKHKEFQVRVQKSITDKPVDNAVIKSTDNIKVEDPIAGEGLNVTPTTEKKDTEFKEDSVNKGGVNEKPTTPRPEAPRGQESKSDNVDPTIDL